MKQQKNGNFMTHNPQNSNGLALFLLLLLGIIWGSGYSIAKLAMQNGVPPLGYSFWQSLGPAILLGLTAFIQKMPLQLTRVYLPYYLVCGLVGIALPNTTMYFVAPHLPAGLLAVIVNTVPVMTYLIALCVGEERFNIWRFIGIICAMLGILLVIIPKASLPSPAMVPWVLLALFAPLCFALCVIYIAHCQLPGSSLSHAAGMLLTSAILLTPLIVGTHNFYPLWPPFSLPKWLVLLEIFLSSLGYILFFQLLKISGPVFYSLVSAVVAFIGLVWGRIIFAEHLTVTTTLAVICILVGISLVTLQQKVLRQRAESFS